MNSFSAEQAFALATQHHEAGRLAEAETLYRQILAAEPHHPDALHHLGLIALQVGRHELAIELLGRAISRRPHDLTARTNLGEAYRLAGRKEEAIAELRRVLAADPYNAVAGNNLGLALAESNELDAAIAAYRQALISDPTYTEAYNNLGVALANLDRLDDAVATYRAALRLDPRLPQLHKNLALALAQQGQIDEAVSAHRQAVELRPGHPRTLSNLIYALLFQPGSQRGAIVAEQERWNTRFSRPSSNSGKTYLHDQNPARPLRIGYVSPDFREHVVGRNLVPLFRAHDRDIFEIFCYSGAAAPDRLTDMIRNEADHWRSTVGTTDQDLVARIGEDRVDILVDLSQHMAGNRLPVFACAPAPVQVSFAGYPESSGLEAIGYRLSDRFLESESEDRRAEVAPELRSPSPDFRPAEQVFLLDSFWCYDPCGLEIPIADLPALSKGYLTFGSLNTFSKFNEPTLRLWGRILAGIPKSRLVLLASPGSHRQWIQEILAREGIEPQRIEFVTRQPRPAYLETYHQLDIALDPFPYNGHTTSLDALWMGVPVITLAGLTPVSRGGLSILTNADLSEWIAYSEEDYIRIATELAANIPRLAESRRTLRSRLAMSVLMDAPRFARAIEAAYRTMWRPWCSQHSPSAS